MNLYTKAMVTIELEEYQQLKKLIIELSKPADGQELTEAEHQEATGLLLSRALENPRLFKNIEQDIRIGKYTATFVIFNGDIPGHSSIGVKFVRT